MSIFFQVYDFAYPLTVNALYAYEEFYKTWFYLAPFFGIVLAVLLLVIIFTPIYKMGDVLHRAWILEHDFLEALWTFVPLGAVLILGSWTTTILEEYGSVYDAMDYEKSLVSDSSNNKIAHINVIGNQWYWTYDYGFYGSLNNSDSVTFLSKQVDSYNLLPGDLTFLDNHSLSVDIPLYLPSDSKIFLNITANDVIHSFWVPSLGIKIDAIPGRINTTVISIPSLNIDGSVILPGWCAELCGPGHGRMPIVIEMVSFNDWLSIVFSDKD